jgi:hypothetical protein
MTDYVVASGNNIIIYLLFFPIKIITNISEMAILVLVRYSEPISDTIQKSEIEEKF